MRRSLPAKPSDAVRIPKQTGQAASIRDIDALFETAGLVRNQRGKAAVTRRRPFERADRSDLSPHVVSPNKAPNGVRYFAVPAWAKFGRNKTGWLWHGFSTRLGGLTSAYRAQDAPGDLNLGFTPADDRSTVLRNRQLLVEAVTGSNSTPLITLRQIHSSVLMIAGDPSTAKGQSASPCKGDGLMTAEPGLLLGIQTADCIPVLVADRKRRVVAAFHAGWRGTVKRIVENGIGRMRLEFGCRPQDLVAAIGPGIGPCCYSVGDEVLGEFESQFVYARDLFCEVDDAEAVRRKYPMLFLTQRAPGHSPMGPSLHLHLVEANRRQLLDAGLEASAIQVVGGCTSCNPDLFFSHRAAHGHTGRMMSVIGIRP